jgi:hypothetical protein
VAGSRSVISSPRRLPRVWSTSRRIAGSTWSDGTPMSETIHVASDGRVSSFTSGNGLVIHTSAAFSRRTASGSRRSIS